MEEDDVFVCVCWLIGPICRQLRRAVVDHVSDGFLDLNSPILNLVSAAERRDPEIERYAEDFRQHAESIIKVGENL